MKLTLDSILWLKLFTAKVLKLVNAIILHYLNVRLSFGTLLRAGLMPTPNPWDYAEKSGKEHAHQAALFMWANMATNFGYHVANFKQAYIEPGWALKNARGDLIPQLKWLFAIHNQGHGDVIRGGLAKAEGVKAGVFDLFLPVPVRRDGAYNLAFPPQHLAGLFLEMKVDKNQPSNDQLEFQRFAREFHYAAEIAWGWLEAREKILDYLGLPRYNAAISLQG